MGNSIDGHRILSPASSMMLWQVVPCSRAECVKAVVQRFRMQTLKGAKLCLVVNGWDPSIDVERYLKDSDAWPDLLLRTETSREGKAIALNAALAELKGELVAIRDDDDIQGSEDLEEALWAYETTGAKAVVKLPHRVLLNGTLWLFAEELANTWCEFEDGTPDCRISGSNMLFHTNLGIDFPLVRAIESRQWAKNAMEQLGVRIWRTSVDNYTWVRGRNDHLWQAPEVVVRHEYGMNKVRDSQKFVPAMPARRLVAGNWEWVPPPTFQDLLGG